MAGSECNYSVIMKDGHTSYSISLDELDAAILPVDMLLNKFRGKGSTLLWNLDNAAAPVKHRDFDELTGEVCEFEVLAERNGPETQHDQMAQDFFCHICKIFVLKIHTSAHYKSKNHGIMLKIALNAMERINKHMMQHNDMPLLLSADQDKDGISSPYCAVCNTTIAESNKNNHEKCSKHQILLKRDELLAKLYTLHEDSDETVVANTEGVSVPSNKEGIVTNNNDKENKLDNESKLSNVQTDFDLTNTVKSIAMTPAVKKRRRNENDKCGGFKIKTENKKEISIETPEIKPFNVKDNQIGTKLPYYYCTICAVSVPTNKENIVIHNSGKAHKKNMSKNANRHNAKPDVDVVDTKKPLKEVPNDKTVAQCIPFSNLNTGKAPIKDLLRMTERDPAYKYEQVPKISNNDWNNQAVRSIATSNGNLSELNAVTNVTATDCVSANKLKDDYPKENEISNVNYKFKKVYDFPLRFMIVDGCKFSLICLSYQGLFTENFRILGRIRCLLCQWPIHLEKVNVDQIETISEKKLFRRKIHVHPNCTYLKDCIVCSTILINIVNHLSSREHKKKHAEEWFEDNFDISVTTLINAPNGNSYHIPKMHVHGLIESHDIKGLNGVFCVLCRLFVALDDVREHVSSTEHIYNMQTYQTYNLDQDNLIRRIMSAELTIDTEHDNPVTNPYYYVQNVDEYINTNYPTLFVSTGAVEENSDVNKESGNEATAKKKKVIRRFSRVAYPPANSSFVIRKSKQKGHRLIKIQIHDLSDKEDGDSDPTVSVQYIATQSYDEVLRLSESLVSKISKELGNGSEGYDAPY